MTAYVAFAAFLALVLVVTAFSALLDNQRRAHARREDLLLNQLLHATGNTWQPPPAEEKPPPADPAERRTGRYSAAPELIQP